MTSGQFPSLVCKSCKGTGIWDAGTVDEGKCRADHCHEGFLLCSTCSNGTNDEEPAVGTVRVYNDYIKRDEVFPLCRRHLGQAQRAEDEECRGDYERDMAKDGGR
jgi:hypothetical protein